MENWLQKESELILSVFKRLPVEIDRGEGCYLIDLSGNRYLDFLSGLGVNVLGYGHPAVLQAIQKQISRNMHLSNYFVQDVQLELAEKVLQKSGYDRIFFSNSGTESIEGILKLIKKYANRHKKHQVVCFQNAFHGRSLGSLSITAQQKYQQDFQPLLPQIVDVPFNDPAALEKSISSDTAAIFLEFVQGEGGVVPVSEEVVKVMKSAQEKHNVLIVADEIQSGIGRTGKFLSFEHYEIKPDLVALAKAIGGGLPLGAFLLNEELDSVFARGEHGTTFGGNPVSCAAGLATLEVLDLEDLYNRTLESGNYLYNLLNGLQNKYPRLITEVRGIGLMQGVQLTVDAFPLVLEGLKHNVIFNSTAGKVMRFLPPLIMNKSQIEDGVGVFDLLLQKIQN